MSKQAISNKSLQMLKGVEIAETGKRKIVRLTHDRAILFLCALYEQIKNDERVLALARIKAEKYAREED
jgi:hypothetical protein